MASQDKLDKAYMAMAKEVANLSYCNRAKVGCLIVKDTHIISEGYNGTPKGLPNVCEDSAFTTLRYVLHAESNAITKLARSTISSEGATVYVTMAPCYDCCKLIIQSGIKRVVYKSNYHSDGIELLELAGVTVEKLEEGD
jgi:dCMP deaminase